MCVRALTGVTAFKQLLDEVFVASEIIKVEISVVSAEPIEGQG